MSAVTLSPQQTRAIDFVKNGTGNAILEAVAGAGKTFTLVQMCSHLQGTAIFAAFNKAIAGEIGERLKASGVRASASAERLSTATRFGLNSAIVSLMLTRWSSSAIASVSMMRLRPFAETICREKWVKRNRRIFDNKKVSDHFAIIPTAHEAKMHQVVRARRRRRDGPAERFRAVSKP